MFSKVIIEESQEEPNVFLLYTKKDILNPLLKLTFTVKKETQGMFDGYLLIPYNRHELKDVILLGVNYVADNCLRLLDDKTLDKVIRYTAANYFVRKFTNLMWNMPIGNSQGNTLFIREIHCKDGPGGYEYYLRHRQPLIYTRSPIHDAKYFIEEKWPWYLKYRTLYQQV